MLIKWSICPHQQTFRLTNHNFLENISLDLLPWKLTICSECAYMWNILFGCIKVAMIYAKSGIELLGGILWEAFWEKILIKVTFTTSGGRKCKAISKTCKQKVESTTIPQECRKLTSSNELGRCRILKMNMLWKFKKNPQTGSTIFYTSKWSQKYMYFSKHTIWQNICTGAICLTMSVPTMIPY